MGLLCDSSASRLCKHRSDSQQFSLAMFVVFPLHWTHHTGCDDSLFSTLFHCLSSGFTLKSLFWSLHDLSPRKPEEREDCTASIVHVSILRRHVCVPHIRDNKVHPIDPPNLLNRVNYKPLLRDVSISAAARDQPARPFCLSLRPTLHASIAPLEVGTTNSACLLCLSKRQCVACDSGVSGEEHIQKNLLQTF